MTAPLILFAFFLYSYGPYGFLTELRRKGRLLFRREERIRLFVIMNQRSFFEWKIIMK